MALSDKEVAAQRKHFFNPSVRTFASGGDIHSHQVPEANYGTEYSPGAVPPEMPVFMVGLRKGRVDQAIALESRAVAVADKARNLVVLETEDHYLKMEENLKKLQLLRTSYAKRKDMLDKQLELLDQDKKVDPDMILTAGEFTTRLRLDLNAAQYQYLLELAALERATAGGYCPGFDNVPPAKP
jgi:outer membrane protein TolC